MRVLVTGATGYIGFHIASALRQKGHHVSGMVRDGTSARAHQLLVSEVQLLVADLTDRESYRQALHAVDVVVHTALDPTDPIGSDSRLISETQIVAGAGRPIHFVYTSGLSVHGTHDRGALDEGTPIDPTSFRAAVERQLADSGLAHTIVRPGFVYGGETLHSPLGTWFAMGVRSDPLYYGRRDKTWSWVHVSDLADGYARILSYLDAHNGETYCFVDDHPVPTLPLVERAVAVAGYEGQIPMAPIEDEAADLRVFDRDMVALNAKAKRNLGWRPRYASIMKDLPHSFAAWAASRT